MGEWFDTLGDTITPPAHPPHFSTLMKWWMRNRGSIVRQWMGGWMGIGDVAAAAGDARIHLSSKPKISLHVIHWWGWKSSCYGLFSSLFTFLVFGNFVDYVHVNAWIRELWQQCSITVPLVGAPLSEGGNPPLRLPTISYDRGRRDPLPLSNSHWEDKRRRGKGGWEEMLMRASTSSAYKPAVSQ